MFMRLLSATTGRRIAQVPAGGLPGAATPAVSSRTRSIGDCAAIEPASSSVRSRPARCLYWAKATCGSATVMRLPFTR